MKSIEKFFIYDIIVCERNIEFMKTDKKEIILNATEKLLVNVSDNDLSMSMIAKEAGIAKGGIYYHFKSKEEVLYAVIKRAYSKAIREYLENMNSSLAAIDKLRTLFHSLLKKEFRDEKKNLLIALHINENPLLHNYLKLVAIEEISPILEKILIQGKDEGIIDLKVTPSETSEMIIAVLSFLLDGNIFNTEKSDNKLTLFSKVLDLCLGAEPGTFSFISE